MSFLRRHRRIAVLSAVAAVVLLVTGTAYMAGGYIVYDKLTRVDAHCGGRYEGNTPASFTSDKLDTGPYLMPTYESVSFASRGDPGVTISGWWVPGSSADAPVVIEVHGLNSCKRSPTVLLPAGMLHRLGYGVLLIDLRNEGESTVNTGRYAGGVIEYKDVLGAWDWLRSTKGIPAERIGLLGMSLGAATALIAMGQEPGLAAIWEDSGYSDISMAISDELARNGYPRFLAPAGTFFGRIFGVDITSMGPLDSLPRLNSRPIAIVHGSGDTRMPMKHAETLRDAATARGARPYVWFVAGSEHTQAVFDRPAEYEERLAAFFGPAIGVPAATLTSLRLPALIAA
jgi:dipeptidyl aminopeptidase/acylaminoacyl peptidase